MSRTSDLAYRVANEPDTLTADERATVAAMRRQSNAYDRARQQAELGNAPTLVDTTVKATGIICEVWRVMSRSAEGAAHHVTLWDNGRTVQTSCTCPAGQSDQPCWHRGGVRLARQGDIPSVNEAGFSIRHKLPAPVISAAMLSGKA